MTHWGRRSGSLKSQGLVSTSALLFIFTHLIGSESICFFVLILSSILPHACLASSGYHQLCHLPPVESSADLHPWFCRKCIFALAVRVSPSLYTFHINKWGSGRLCCWLVFLYVAERGSSEKGANLQSAADHEAGAAL